MSRTDNIVEMIVEIPKGSHYKYELNSQNQQLYVDRIIQTPIKYFFNYGCIPNTLGEDGDPIDVVLLNSEQIYPLCRINVKVLGMLETTDEHGNDNKIIAVPCDKVDPQSSCLNDIADLCCHEKNKIRYFFEHYKDLEPSKWIKVYDYKNCDETLSYIKQFS